MYPCLRRNAVILACLVAVAAAAPLRIQADDDRKIADMLAAMLRAGRAVISSEQDRINDAAVGRKGLDGASVLTRVVAIFTQNMGLDPNTLPPGSRASRLLHAEMDAIKDVMDSNQASIDTPGVGFKGFIPAVFSRLVSEAFSARTKDQASMRVTAPLDLVRNRKSKPDVWETAVIQDRFLSPNWPAGQSYEALLNQNGRSVFRIAVPEYYTHSCLSCHGQPKGELDVTGYPMEGAALHDLGGVISITLTK